MVVRDGPTVSAALLDPVTGAHVPLPQSPEVFDTTLGCCPAPSDVTLTLRLQVPLPVLVDEKL